MKNKQFKQSMNDVCFNVWGVEFREITNSLFNAYAYHKSGNGWTDENHNPISLTANQLKVKT